MNNPLSYDSQKAIIQYMDPNLRIRFSLQCPAIRVAEKSVPLEIDRLRFGAFSTEINETGYHLKIYRAYPPGVSIPKIHSDENKLGGSVADLDQFGLEDGGYMNTVLPGDVDLYKKERREPNDEEVQETQQNLEYMLQGNEQRLKDLVDNGPGDEEPSAHQRIILDLEKEIDWYHEYLIPYHCKRDNIPASFECYLQLIIKSSKGTKIERLQYNRKLHEAQKYLNNLFFGGRAPQVQVNKLQLVDVRWIYRFPIGLRLNVKSAMMSPVVEYKLLDNIIHPENYSTIDLVIVDIILDPENYNQSAVKQAKSLKIKTHFQSQAHFEVLRRLENRHVTLSTATKLSNYVRLARYWLENGKEVGTAFTFGFESKYWAQQCLGNIKNRNLEYAKEQDQSFVTFKMPSQSSQLRIYIERILHRDEFSDPYVGAIWHLIFEVEENPEL